MSKKIKIEERLNEIISEKDDQIQGLESKIEELESQLDYVRWQWQQHKAFENDDFFKQMPFPRLEMRLNRVSKENWYSIEWVYGLVYKHGGDTFGDNNMLRFIPFSKTTSDGGHGTFDTWCKAGKLNLPYRDSMHIHVESSIFNLPAFIICQEKGIINKIEQQRDNSDTISKMKSDGTKKQHTITG